MKQIGTVLIVIGVIIIMFAFYSDTTVSVEKTHFDKQYGISYSLPERVNNIGLMNEKQNKIILGGIILLSGLILFVSSGFNKNVNQQAGEDTDDENENSSSSPSLS